MVNPVKENLVSYGENALKRIYSNVEFKTFSGVYYPRIPLQGGTGMDEEGESGLPEPRGGTGRVTDTNQCICLGDTIQLFEI